MARPRRRSSRAAVLLLELGVLLTYRLPAQVLLAIQVVLSGEEINRLPSHISMVAAVEGFQPGQC